MSKFTKMLLSTMLILLISNFTFLINEGLIIENNVKAALPSNFQQAIIDDGGSSTSVCSHTYSWVTTRVVTCTSNGSKAYKCSKCGNVSQTQTVYSTGHKYKVTYTKSSAYNHEKLEECTVCGYEIGTEQAHTYSSATCTRAKKCTKCTYTTGAPLGHDYEPEYESVSVDKHVKIVKCSRCSDEIEATENHSFDSANKCTACGFTKACEHQYSAKYESKSDSIHFVSRKCTKCGLVSNFSEAHLFNSATCTASKKCRRCGQTSGAPLGHDITYIDINSTKHRIMCSRCDYVVDETHNMVGNECTKCDYDKDNELVIVGPSQNPSGDAVHKHNYVWSPIKNPTCTESGSAIQKCSCGVTGATKTLKALGHALDTTYEVGSAEKHAKKVECTRCDFETEKVENHTFGSNNKCTGCEYPKTCIHSYAAATCTSPKKCVKCGATTGAVLGHSYKYIEKDAINHEVTCSRKGCTFKKTLKHIFKYNTCEDCHYVKPQEVVDVCSHTYEWKVKRAATCVVAGEKEYKCTKCGEIQDTARIEKLKHDYEYAEDNATKHKVTCKKCDYDVKKDHSFVDNMCVYCGYKKGQQSTNTQNPQEPQNPQNPQNPINVISIEWINENTKENNKYEIKVDETWNLKEKVSITPKDISAKLIFEFVEKDAAKLKEIKTKVDLNSTTGNLKAKAVFEEGIEIRVIDSETQKQDVAIFMVIEELNRPIIPLPEDAEKPAEKCEELKPLIGHGQYIESKYETNTTMHTSIRFCKECNVKVSVGKSEKHTNNMLEIKSISEEKHTKIMECKVCKAKYAITESHKLNTKGVCECGFVKKAEEVVTKKIEFTSDKLTIKVGEILKLGEKVRITPSNSNVSLLFEIISGENGVAQIEKYTGKIEAKKVCEQGIKVRVMDANFKLYESNQAIPQDEITIIIKENPALKDEENEVKPPKFEDVEEDSWYEEDVNDAVQDGIFNGTSDNTFNPNGAITRGMFVTVLARLDKADVNNFVNVFDDVKEDAYYKESINWAVANGIVNGMGNGKFEPDAQITREAMSKIIYNYIKLQHKGLLTNQTDTTKFADDAEIASWAKEAVYALKGIGLVNGKTNNNFKPKDTVTRAEAAVILQRLSDKIKSDSVTQNKPRCSGEGLVETHKNKIIQKYEIITNDTHRVNYECPECKSKWVDKPVAHKFENGKCICGEVCEHKGSKIKQEKYNEKQELIEQTICENCKVVVKEEIKVPAKEPEKEENKPTYVISNYSPSDFGQNKPKMTKDSYTEADWDRMEAELKARVEKAGFGTRAGAVEAALYLASLDCAMPYRGTPMDRGANIGAYPKIGLNRTWGSYVRTTKEVTYNGKVYKKGYNAINGMDCGAFVAWAMVNGGVKPEGYSTSPGVSGYTNDKGVYISQSVIRGLGWNNYKGVHKLKDVADQIEPGDIALTYGYRGEGRGWTHIGLVVGVDNNNVYIAESTTGSLNKLVVTTVSKTYTGDVLGYIVLADEKLYTAKNADGTENKGNMPQVW